MKGEPMMKKLVSLLLALTLLVGCMPLAFAEGETRMFTDSTGRTVELPAQIDRIAVSGSLAKMIVFAIAPDKMVGIPTPWDETELPFVPEQYRSMTAIGQLYGGKGEMNPEQLLVANPQVVIDVGESKGTISEGMDELTEQTGIPFVHIEASLSTLDQAYTMLGELLGMEDEAAVLSAYCKEIYDRTVAISGSVDKVSLLYITGEEGLNVIARDSYHSEVIDMLADNQAVIESPSSKGTGNEVDLEQLYMWDPAVILFSDCGVADTAKDDPAWQVLTAIANDTYYKVPVGPHNWMGFPPSCQRLLGMMWMAKILYPEAADYDLYAETARFYDLFYHWELTQDEFNALTAGSVDKLHE